MWFLCNISCDATTLSKNLHMHSFLFVSVLSAISPHFLALGNAKQVRYGLCFELRRKSLTLVAAILLER